MRAALRPLALAGATVAVLLGCGKAPTPPPAAPPTPAAVQPYVPSERLGPLDGAHLTATTDAFLRVERSASPLTEAQIQRATAMIRDYLRSCDVAEDATARFTVILTPSQMARLKSYPGGAAVDFAAPDVLVGRVLELLEKYRPSASPARQEPRPPEEAHQSPKMIRVLEGLYQMLQDPACDLSEAQAREAFQALEGTRDALVRIREVEVGMREILTPEQIRLLPPDLGGAEHDLCILRALEAWLADPPAPPGTPTWTAPARRQPFNGSLTSLCAGLVVLEQSESVRLSAEQRTRLLAQVRESRRAMEAVAAANHLCLAALTPEQWKAIYESPVEEAFFGRFGYRHPLDAVAWLVEAYGKRAAPKGVQGDPPDSRRFDHTMPPFIRTLEGLNYLERQEDSPDRPTAAQARNLHDALAGVGEDAKLYWDATPRLFELLTPEQSRYLRDADAQLDHEQNYAATLLLMLHLQRASGAGASGEAR